MFKLVVLSGLLAVALAKPSTLVLPIGGRLVSEKTIESYGNSVIHATAPVIPPGLPLVNATEQVPTDPIMGAKEIIADKAAGAVYPYYPPSATPIVETAAYDSLVSTTTLRPLPTLLPLGPPQNKLVEKPDRLADSAVEKSESLQQLMEKKETMAQQEKLEPTLKPSSELLQRNETALNKELPGKMKSQRQVIIHEAAPAVLTYQAAAIPDILPPPVLIPIGIPPYGQLALNSTTDLLQKLPSDEQLKSAQAKQQLAERYENVEDGVIQELATGLHVAAAPVYYYPYPAAIVAEKSISSYGHSIIHGV